MDKVFKMMYHEEEHILHLEFETGYDKQLPSRLLAYNAGLYRDYHLPVITIVVYPFEVTMAVPPLCIKSSKDTILTFQFKTLSLFTLDAEDVVREQHTAMYPLLPTMQNVHANLVAQAMQELAELYRDNEVTLGQQLIWMELLLERTGTVADVEKGQIKERLNMFDELWEKSPTIQKMREQYRMQGVEQGIERGLEQGLQALQRSLVNVVRAKYPDLAELAQQQAPHFNKPDTLEMLIQQVVLAPNASTARKMLQSGTEI